MKYSDPDRFLGGIRRKVAPPKTALTARRHSRDSRRGPGPPESQFTVTMHSSELHVIVNSVAIATVAIPSVTATIALMIVVSTKPVYRQARVIVFYIPRPIMDNSTNSSGQQEGWAHALNLQSACSL